MAFHIRKMRMMTEAQWEEHKNPKPKQKMSPRQATMLLGTMFAMAASASLHYPLPSPPRNRGPRTK